MSTASSVAKSDEPAAAQTEEPIGAARKQGFIRALDGTRLHYVHWQPAEVADDADGAVLVHGYGEHIRRYEHVAAHLVGLGLVVVGIDVRGHGQSDGQRGHVEHYDDYLLDVAAAFDKLHELHPQGRRALIGHSNGGLICLRYALAESGTRPDVLVLSAPLLELAMKVPKYKELLGVGLSKLVPGLTMKSEIDPDALSTDPEVGRAYMADPMVHFVATARYFTEMTAASADALARGGELKLPALVMHGDSDPIVSPEGTRKLASARAETKLILYPGMRHEILNERDKARVLDDISTFLSEHEIRIA